MFGLIWHYTPQGCLSMIFCLLGNVICLTTAFVIIEMVPLVGFILGLSGGIDWLFFEFSRNG